MSQRVKTSACGLVLPRSSSPENGHLRKNYASYILHILFRFLNFICASVSRYKMLKVIVLVFIALKSDPSVHPKT
jgi:hypothetical protein